MYAFECVNTCTCIHVPGTFTLRIYYEESVQPWTLSQRQLVGFQPVSFEFDCTCVTDQYLEVR